MLAVIKIGNISAVQNDQAFTDRRYASVDFGIFISSARFFGVDVLLLLAVVVVVENSSCVWEYNGCARGSGC